VFLKHVKKIQLRNKALKPDKKITGIDDVVSSGEYASDQLLVGDATLITLYSVRLGCPE